jgi:hypothetical protein
MTKPQTTHTNNTSYPRVIKHTNIQFTNEEIQLLNNGMKYNLCNKAQNWLETLALEA